jgi:NADPH:quinone reductase-like Zn-dependent oxidoreductase
MKAVVYDHYGPPEVLEIKQVDKPIPKNDEILIKIHATTVNRTDTEFRSAKYFVSRLVTGLVKPRKAIAGSEFAGNIVEVGADVQAFQVGDKVFGFEDVRSGAHAEYMSEAANGSVAKMPEGFSYQSMAPAAEGATYAISVIRAAGVKKGQKVLVYGASGAIGSAAVQILKYLGTEVIAVCGTKNIKIVKNLGADKVIDFEKEDFTRITDNFDLIFDAVGKSSYGACKKLLAPKGIYYSTELGVGGQNPLLAIWFALTGSRKVIFPISKINKEKVEYIKQLMETGAYKPLIDRTYQLDEIIEATKYVETGQKIGSVVIEVV